MELIKGNEVRSELLKTYQETIEQEDLKITLAIVQVGDNPESNKYIKNKVKYTEQVGIKTIHFKLMESTSEEEIISLIKQLNADETITGIILQSPTPRHINFKKCARLILPEKDVDGFTSENLFAIRDNDEQIIPCTVKGILKLLEYYDISIEGENIVIIGRSNIVGRPMADSLINRNATVTVCHSKTKDLAHHTKKADIIVSAVGEPNLITADMVKDDFIGIDVGISFKDGKLVGDINKDAYSKASFITPVPGGVGPMTVAMIIDNLIELKHQKIKRSQHYEIETTFVVRLCAAYHGISSRIRTGQKQCHHLAYQKKC